MNNGIIDVISVGILLLIIIGGVIVYVLQVLEEVKNNRMKTKKEIELLDTKISKTQIISEILNRLN